MNVVTILHAKFPDDADEVISIFREYVSSPKANLDFQNYEVEFRNLPGNYAEPDGRIALAWEGNSVVGCAALRPVKNDICEIKRVYVRPSARGNNIGRRLVEHMISEARLQGYAQMCLDVLPEFVAAQQLYTSLGFTVSEAVSYNPVPGTKFMALTL